MNHERFPGAKYANIFSYLKSDNHEGYKEMDEDTLGLVGHIQGYLGMNPLPIMTVELFLLAIGTH